MEMILCKKFYDNFLISLNNLMIKIFKFLCNVKQYNIVSNIGMYPIQFAFENKKKFNCVKIIALFYNSMFIKKT